MRIVLKQFFKFTYKNQKLNLSSIVFGESLKNTVFGESPKNDGSKIH